MKFKIPRSFTNIIRFILDECIPPVIRDSKWFMFPVFYIWYKGKNISLYMNFKTITRNMSEEDYAKLYQNLDSLGTDRPTDMNQPSMNFAYNNFDKTAKNLLDVGCGRGYWLNFLSKKTNLELSGCDVYEHVHLEKSTYTKGSIYQLPFPDKSFDIVTCCHLLEHLKNPTLAMAELKRVAKKQVIIVTPCQRYYYYTADMHILFFPSKESLQNVVQIEKNVCENKLGDWVFIGDMS